MIDQPSFEDLLHAIEDRIRRELRVRCEAYTPDFRMPEVFSALTALLARQATLAIEFVSAPQLWNSHSAPLFLRAMADVHITLSWILLDPNTRARQYIDHGLGQAKLELEHRKNRMESAGEDSNEGLKQIIQAGEAWINVQISSRPTHCSSRGFSRRRSARRGGWDGCGRACRAGLRAP
jgi:hypothetical protein